MSWWDTRGQRWAALWTMTHILLSLSLQRLFWKPQPYISTDFLSLKRHRCTSAEPGHHLNSNTSRLTEYVYRTGSFSDVRLVFDTYEHYEYVTVSTTQHAGVPMSRWETLKVFSDVLLHVSEFGVCRNLDIPLNYYFRKWHKVSETHTGDFSSSGSLTDSGPLNTVNTLSKHIHTTNTLLSTP